MFRLAVEDLRVGVKFQRFYGSKALYTIQLVDTKKINKILSSRISSIIAINSVVSHVKQRENGAKRQFIYYCG